MLRGYSILDINVSLLTSSSLCVFIYLILNVPFSPKRHYIYKYIYFVWNWLSLSLFQSQSAVRSDMSVESWNSNPRNQTEENSIIRCFQIRRLGMGRKPGRTYLKRQIHIFVKVWNNNIKDRSCVMRRIAWNLRDFFESKRKVSFNKTQHKMDLMHFYQEKRLLYTLDFSTWKPTLDHHHKKYICIEVVVSIQSI